jgi:hypothetical protein
MVGQTIVALKFLPDEYSQQREARLRDLLISEHRMATGNTDGLLIGLQLTHSGRYSRPNAKDRGEPMILYRHPILDRRLGLPSGCYPLDAYYKDSDTGEQLRVIKNRRRSTVTTQP